MYVQSTKLVTALMHQSLRRFIDHRKGAAAIEFAVVAAMLLLLMVGAADYGMGFYRKMQVQNAAQAGAQYAMLRGFSPSSIMAAVTNATSFSEVTATPAPSQFCGCPTSIGVAIAACDSTCAGGLVAGTYVTVSAQGTYNTLLSYPLIPDSFTFASNSTVRIR